MFQKMLGILVVFVTVAETTGLTETTMPHTIDTNEKEVQHFQETNEPNDKGLGMGTTHVKISGEPADYTRTTTGQPAKIEGNHRNSNSESTDNIEKHTLSVILSRGTSVSVIANVQDQRGNVVHTTAQSEERKEAPQTTITWEGQVGGFRTTTGRDVIEDNECCYDSGCNSVLGTRSHCASNLHETDSVCVYNPVSLIRKKRGLEDTEIRTTVVTGTTELRRPGLCSCNDGFVNMNSTCKLNVDGVTCCTEIECHNILGTNSTCDHTGGGNQEKCSFLRPKRGLGFEGASNHNILNAEPLNFRGKCICKPGFVLVNEECVFFTLSSTPSGQNNFTGSFNSVCNEWLCSGGKCGGYIRSDQYICNSAIDNVQCYVAKQCVADEFIYIFSCEDPCWNIKTSSANSCYSDYCTTIQCNSYTTLVDDFQCSTAEVIYVSTYLLVLVVMVYANWCVNI